MQTRHGYYSLGDFLASVTAFQQGLELEPANASLHSGLGYALTSLISEV